ncbi:hypothetical protein DM02DRAFT_655698 [Periconia macrospinosa]|uniref:Uncharacterized protein n=1 Tax=Periconia macrospinosa TaxID=97972 RepID=A0A2V1DPQ4_9PLEO|nr:hypothetical protein DM02DRAFT_655698 [Periconia macrospinosa]
MVCEKNINSQRASPPSSISTSSNHATDSNTQDSHGVSDPENHYRRSNTSPNQLHPTSTQPTTQSLYQTTNTSNNTGASVVQTSTETHRQTNLSTTPPPPSSETLTTILESPNRSSTLRQACSLVVRNPPTHRSRSTHSTTSNYRRPSPYAIPPGSRRSQSFPRSVPETTATTTTVPDEMSSSSSSPGNTSTAGSSSGSNPTYQLPYAPFPYPMPPQGGNQGSGSGK